MGAYNRNRTIEMMVQEPRQHGDIASDGTVGTTTNLINIFSKNNRFTDGTSTGYSVHGVSLHFAIPSILSILCCQLDRGHKCVIIKVSSQLTLVSVFTYSTYQNDRVLHETQKCWGKSLKNPPSRLHSNLITSHFCKAKPEAHTTECLIKFDLSIY